MPDGRKGIETPPPKPECTLMDSVVAQVSEQAHKIGYGFIRLPDDDVRGWIVMMNDADAEGMLVQIMERRKENTTE